MIQEAMLTIIKCPVCRNELVCDPLSLKSFTVSENSTANLYHCNHCECDYELRAENNVYTGWWKIIKLPVIVDDSDAVYKLYEMDAVCTGEVVNEYPLGLFSIQQDRFADMSSACMNGIGYELIIAREDEFDEDGMPTFETDERVLCYQGDCGPRLHLEAARNVNRWRDILKV